MNSEQRLVEKAKRGNKNAFDKLVKIYQDQILYLAYDYSGDYDQAKDIAQDVFLKAYQKLSSFQAKSKFSTWLYRIAVNTCIDYLRKNERFADPVKINNKIKNTPDGTDNDRQDLNDVIEYAVSQLSENQRSSIILKYYQNKTTDEIANILNCDVNTVRVHIFRAIQKMKKILNR